MNNARAHAHNLRIGRLSESGRIYLITCVTESGRLLVNVLAKENQHAETLAYVVMPDHLHWLVRLKDGVKLGQIMRTVKCVSGWRINRELHRYGK